MFPARIEVRYLAHRNCWKAIFVSGSRRESVVGTSPIDAVQYLSRLLQISPESWILRSRSRERALYDEGSISPTSSHYATTTDNLGAFIGDRAPTRVRYAGSLVR
ncbi:MAG TPA: hypothetical protein VL475_14175 [Planctomycetaceae bacterium]|jgi:hypothetical protein|nr:hypothetical protein [Planctomycetaceae bacterium]